jgi:hypothetical protein
MKTPPFWWRFGFYLYFQYSEWSGYIWQEFAMLVRNGTTTHLIKQAADRYCTIRVSDCAELVLSEPAEIIIG